MKTPFKTDPDDITKVYINNNISVQRTVVCAACIVDGVILCGARHWDNIMRGQAKAMGLKPGSSDKGQGFIDQYGQFMDREEGKVVALASGQKLRNPNVGKKLYSEDLY